MPLVQSDLLQIVSGVWGSVLGMEVQFTGEREALPQDDPVLSACVQITGAWAGAVTLLCTATAARRAAAVMFGMEADCISSGDMQDSLGELANMVGGGVKSLLPETCSLSLPTVVEGNDYTFSIRGASPIQETTFTYQEQPVRVTLLERGR